MLVIGVAPDDIYLDPLTKTLSTGDRAGLEVFDSIRLIKQEFPDVHVKADELFVGSIIIVWK